MGAEQTTGRGEAVTGANNIIEIKGRNNIRKRITQLVSDNSGTHILADEKYKAIVGNQGQGFKAVKFGALEGARVKTKNGIKFLLIDGHHRAKSLDTHFDTIMDNNPKFVLKLYDSTDDILEDAKYKAEKRDGVTAISMADYMLKVIGPTKDHALIAPQRIAMHLITGWEDIAGADLASKYSTLTALTFLRDLYTGPEGLTKEFKKTKAFFPGETADQREQLQRALTEMNQIIIDTNLGRKEIASAAFVLVGTRAETIGGQEEAKKQLRSFLDDPVMQKKITDAFPAGDIPQNIYDTLVSNMLTTLARVPQGRVAYEAESIFKALMNPFFSLKDVEAVIAAKAPSATYKRKEEANRRTLRRDYLHTKKGGLGLSDVEKDLIKKLTGVEPDETAEAVQVIQTVDRIVTRATELIKGLADNHPQKGLVRSLMARLRLAQDVIGLRRIIEDTNKQLTNLEAELTREESPSPSTVFPKTETGEPDQDQDLRRLSTLGPDLLRKYRAGHMTLEEAYAAQQEVARNWRRRTNPDDAEPDTQRTPSAPETGWHGRLQRLAAAMDQIPADPDRLTLQDLALLRHIHSRSETIIDALTADEADKE
jgi:hypothetical protein